MLTRKLWFFVGPCSLAIAAALFVSAGLHADEAPPFRTDGSPGKSLEWYRIVDGKFPPADSAHAISGELIQCDHPGRRFRIRVDRDDSQQVSHFDLPLESAMLPYGSIFYHGAPAALQDIPIGTHVHGRHEGLRTAFKRRGHSRSPLRRCDYSTKASPRRF